VKVFAIMPQTFDVLPNIFQNSGLMFKGVLSDVKDARRLTRVDHPSIYKVTATSLLGLISFNSSSCTLKSEKHYSSLRWQSEDIEDGNYLLDG
jgi:hypothetical protein